LDRSHDFKAKDSLDIEFLQQPYLPYSASINNRKWGVKQDVTAELIYYTLSSDTHGAQRQLQTWDFSQVTSSYIGHRRSKPPFCCIKVKTVQYNHCHARRTTGKDLTIFGWID